MRDGPILVAGAGIAGLTAALALVRNGFAVQLFERAAGLEKAGAGVQLSPNATRILLALGLGERLRAVSVRPEAVVLLEARTLRERARIPLGEWGEQRWGAPYLVCHRTALQRTLLDAVLAEPNLAVAVDTPVVGASSARPALAIKDQGGMREVSGSFVIGADGVHSAVRQAFLPSAQPRKTGLTAWRAMLPAAMAAAPGLEALLRGDRVAAFLHPRAHLVAYPMHDGAFNLVAITPSSDEARGGFLPAFRGAAPALSAVLEAAPAWTPWPLLVAPGSMPWTFDFSAALIGDAAHAITPFAAQGAAMAIEDAATLAAAFRSSDPFPAALSAWEEARRLRAALAGRRGRLNRLAWHARGPTALARNWFFSLRPPEKLAAGLDGLYGWDWRKA